MNKLVEVTIGNFKPNSEWSYNDDDTFVMTVGEYRSLQYGKKVYQDIVSDRNDEIVSLQAELSSLRSTLDREREAHKKIEDKMLDLFVDLDVTNHRLEWLQSASPDEKVAALEEELARVLDENVYLDFWYRRAVKPMLNMEFIYETYTNDTGNEVPPMYAGEE